MTLMCIRPVIIKLTAAKIGKGKANKKETILRNDVHVTLVVVNGVG